MKPYSKIKKYHEMLKSGEITAVELTKQYIDAVEKENPTLNAYVKTTFSLALKSAEKVDEKLKYCEEIGLL